MASDMNFGRGAVVHSNVFGDQLDLRDSRSWPVSADLGARSLILTHERRWKW
jgi:hypothetical protein